MSGPNDDLLPLFAAEARERLERVGEALPEAQGDPERCRLARRELHALKGASRMMGLGEIADLCHRAEEALADPSSRGVAEAGELLDDLIAMIEGVSAQDGEGDSSGAAATGGAGTAQPRGRDGATRDLRVGTHALDGLADRAARLRIQALALGIAVDRCQQLALFAQEGLHDPDPRTALATLSTSLERLGLDLDAAHRGVQRLADRQLDVLLGLQVQPLRPFLDGLARHARELARSLGKEVEVEVEARDSQLDRRITEALQEAFLHLVRNAVDHGIEDRDERARSGKPGAGRVRLVAEGEAGRVRIRVTDDGRGIDPGTVRAAARRSGVATDDEVAALSDEDAVRLVFRAGFSTRDQVSEVSGRGIGLDAVDSAVRAVGGTSWVSSRPGVGTEVLVEVPVARRGERVVVVRVARGQVALPAALVRGFLQPREGQLSREDDRLQLQRGGRWLPVMALGARLGEGVRERPVVVETRVGDDEMLLAVDGVVGEEEVITRPLPSWLGVPPLFDAMAVLASGRPVPVLAPRQLLGETGAAIDGLAADQPEGIDVLLVEDSRVTREMLRRVLEEGGVAVTAVSSAEEGLARLTSQRFDCLITDIEMPGMDGLDLTRRVRADPDLGHLPVIVVSTRNTAADRIAGLEAGADAYLTKQELDSRELVELAWRMGRSS